MHASSKHATSPEAVDNHGLPLDEGSPWQRGQTDAAFGRTASPHYFTSGGRVVQKEDMTDEQINEYYDGYDDQYACESSDDELLSASYEQDAWNWEEEE